MAIKNDTVLANPQNSDIFDFQTGCWNEKMWNKFIKFPQVAIKVFNLLFTLWFGLVLSGLHSYFDANWCFSYRWLVYLLFLDIVVQGFRITLQLTSLLKVSFFGLIYISNNFRRHQKAHLLGSQQQACLQGRSLFQLLWVSFSLLLAFTSFGVIYTILLTDYYIMLFVSLPTKREDLLNRLPTRKEMELGGLKPQKQLNLLKMLR